MLYGIHIGLIISSILTVRANWQARYKVAEVVRVIALFILTTAACSFIGLIISDIIKAI